MQFERTSTVTEGSVIIFKAFIVAVRFPLFHQLSTRLILSCLLYKTCRTLSLPSNVSLISEMSSDLTGSGSFMNSFKSIPTGASPPAGIKLALKAGRTGFNGFDTLDSTVGTFSSSGGAPSKFTYSKGVNQRLKALI